MAARPATIGPVLVQPSPFPAADSVSAQQAPGAGEVPSDVFSTFDYLTHALGRSLPVSITAAKAASGRLARTVS